MVAGYSKVDGGSVNGDFSVIRLNTDGSLDTTFSDDGKLVAPVANSDEHSVQCHQQADGKLRWLGQAEPKATPVTFLIRLNANGSLDTTFSDDGKPSIPISSGRTWATKSSSRPTASW